jgi:drug/metabolite transporter (DMT)-like permease
LPLFILQNLPAEISSVYAYINIIAVLLGAAIFGETLNAAIAQAALLYLIVLGQLFVAKRH